MMKMMLPDYKSQLIIPLDYEYDDKLLEDLYKHLFMTFKKIV